MEYIVSARKYRPTSFDSVVGQESLTTTLKNAVKEKRLAHAYLFCGPRGVGKTTCARIFAKAINCEHPSDDGEACGECESCKAFAEQRSYNIFELDAASNNSVENIKSLMEQTRIPPQVGKYKVFIIDEVHMLSSQAFNAFLKTLEEPPSHVVFILATTEKHKILPTIISRCQIYDFERMTVPVIVDHLKNVAHQEGISYEEEALAVIAEKADGGMRDALSIFDQTASFSQGDITYKKVIEDLNVLDSENYFNIIDLALENRVSEIMVLLNNIINKGFDAGLLVEGLERHVRNVLMAKDKLTIPLLETSASVAAKYEEQARKCPVGFLYKALRIMNRCDVNYKQSGNKRLLVEITLIEVAQITQDDDAPAAGHRPARLKSLFKRLTDNDRSKPAAQVAGTGKTAPHRHSEPVGAGSLAHNHTTSDNASRHGSNAETAPTPPPSQARLSSLSIKSLGMSFGNLMESEKRKPTFYKEPEIENKDEDNAFSQEDLALQWRAMCNRMPPTMLHMAVRLKNLTPVITTFPAIELLVESNIFLSEVQGIAPRIRATLAKHLHNGRVSFKVRLARQQELKPRKSKREILDHLRNTNPAIKKFCDAMRMDIR